MLYWQQYRKEKDLTAMLNENREYHVLLDTLQYIREISELPDEGFFYDIVCSGILNITDEEAEQIGRDLNLEIEWGD